MFFVIGVYIYEKRKDNKDYETHKEQNLLPVLLPPQNAFCDSKEGRKLYPLQCQ